MTAQEAKALATTYNYSSVEGYAEAEKMIIEASKLGYYKVCIPRMGAQLKDALLHQGFTVQAFRRIGEDTIVYWN